MWNFYVFFYIGIFNGYGVVGIKVIVNWVDVVIVVIGDCIVCMFIVINVVGLF